ncbi:MAG: bifunctional folylpolyglutamate synthase/dihydrofolate synthase [Candidatus Bipolaricaulaceae bacterium]
MSGLPWEALAPGWAVKPGLERVNVLLDRLDHPERKFPAIHVGGTNGKGSVVAFLEAALGAGGVKVGTYTSPDLGDPTERIRVAAQSISAGGLDELVRRAILPLDDLVAGPGRPTSFEALTAAAFGHFAAQRVELALVEVGLGGRFDATRALARPLLSIVTSVEQDHRDFFGPGTGRAAWEKAGIARSGVPFLTAERKPEVLATFAQECREVGAALVLVDPEDVEPVEVSWDRAVWRSRDDPLGLGQFETRLLGLYQRGNLALALAALAELVGGFPVPREAIREGLGTAAWAGRFEVLSRRPYIVLDGAHNPAGSRALVATLEHLPRPRGTSTLVFGVLRDKVVREMAEILFPWFDRVVLVASRSERALPPAALAHQARRLGCKWCIGGPVGPAVSDVVRDLGEEDMLVICGSLTVVGEARRALVPAP